MRHCLIWCASLVAINIVVGCGGASIAGEESNRSTIAYTFPSGKGGDFIAPGFDAVEGNLFQIVGSNVRLTSLGYEYQRIQQLPSITAIFDSSGKILAWAQISATDSLQNGYYWHSIPPITLMQGNQYYIGSLHGSGASNSYYWNTRTATVPSFMSDLGTYFKISTTIGGGSWQFGGGTSQYGSGEIRHYVGNFMAEVQP